MTPRSIDSLADRLERLLTEEASGRARAKPSGWFTFRLGVSPRVLQVLVGMLIDRGQLVGSSCDSEHPGYFLILDEDDLIAGTAHIRSRALSSLARVSRLKRAAEAKFGAESARLFDLSEVGA